MARKGCSRGTSALEFAILLPVLMAVLSGLFDLGLALHQYHQLCKSVRAAARHLNTGPAHDAIRQQQARNLVVYGNLQGLGASQLPQLTTAMVHIREPQADPGVRLVTTGQGTLSLVTVTVSGYHYQPLLLPSGAGLPFSDISLTMPYTFF